MERESYRTSVASVATNLRFPAVQHREIRHVEQAPLKYQIENKARQSQQEDDRPDNPRYRPHVSQLKVFCHRYRIPSVIGFSV